jgi:sporulation protein YlmC with PRC-barrel domain
MKASIWYGATAGMLSLATGILGQDEITSSSNSASYVPTSKLVGRKITSSQGDEIGVMKDVVLDLSNGCMAYTVVSTGDAQTGGGKIVVVPWAIYSRTSHPSTLRVKVDRDKIYNAPSFDYTRIDEYVRPDYIDNVYNYYGINPGGLNGVAASKATTAATDATGTAGATASPGEVASTTAGGISLPDTKASTLARATAAANHDGYATNDGSGEATRSARSTGRGRHREERASSEITEEFPSKKTTSSSESRRARRKGREVTPRETPHSTEGED